MTDLFQVAQIMISQFDEKTFKKYEFQDGVMQGRYDSKEDTLLIYFVFINEQKRRKGLFRQFCNRLYELKVKKIVILAVQSFILDTFLTQFVCLVTQKRFKNHGADFFIEF